MQHYSATFQFKHVTLIFINQLLNINLEIVYFKQIFKNPRQKKKLGKDIPIGRRNENTFLKSEMYNIVVLILAAFWSPMGHS